MKIKDRETPILRGGVDPLQELTKCRGWPKDVSFYDYRGAGLRSFVMHVTPETAYLFLACSRGNRIVVRSKVSEMASAIRDEKWLISHQGIALDSNGVFVDGHHRVLAVIASEKCAKMMVTINVPAESLTSIDTGTPRRLHDHLSFMGKKSSVNEVASIRVAVRGKSFVDTKNTGLTPEYLMTALDYFSEGLRFYEGIPQGKKRLQATVVGVLLRAFYSEKWRTGNGHPRKERLRDFVSIWATGQKSTGTTDNKDTAAISLFRFIRENGAPHGFAGRVELYEKIQSGLAAFLNETPMSRIYGVTKEQFPLDDYPLRDEA